MSLSLNLISQLKTLVEEGGSKERIETLEYLAVDSIESFVKEESFFELPTNEVLRIIAKSEIRDIELLNEVISRMLKKKGEESTLLLNVIKIEEATLEECIEILSKFKHSQICRQTSKLFKEEKELPERDYEREINELKKELQTKIKQGIVKPSDFESDICKAAEEGKLTSIKYLVKQCHADVETKDWCGYTPINNASSNGHLDVVKYLYKKCHANVETRDDCGCTPISCASYKGNLEVVKYLYEKCHADIETKDDYGRTPINLASQNGKLNVVKYLYEICRANIETRDNSNRTPLNNATLNNHLDVVKYLHEKCHVN